MNDEWKEAVQWQDTHEVIFLRRNLNNPDTSIFLDDGVRGFQGGFDVLDGMGCYAKDSLE